MHATALRHSRHGRPATLLVTLMACATPISLGAQAPAEASRARAAEAVTFARDVAPIIQQKCQVCHQPNSIAPMALVTYDDARKYARRIRTKVAARLMPPWHIDRTTGIQLFKNDRSLTD
jgi:hypothetical protein